MIRSGQPSSVGLLALVIACAACSRGGPWSHDAGKAFDAGAAPTWTFPTLPSDASVLDAGPPQSDAGPRAWAETQRFPALDGFAGGQRHAAVAIHPNGLPCVAFSGRAGLEFACLEVVTEGDAGVTEGDASNGPGERQFRWQRDVLRAHPENAWLGSQVALIFDHESRPIVVARQLPQVTAHLFLLDGEGWHSEEIPVARGGRDPQLFLQGETLVLIHSSSETHIEPTLWLSRRNGDAQWTHEALVKSYDALPGWYHRSLLESHRLSFCAFDPGAQQITWGRYDLQADDGGDAGPGIADIGPVVGDAGADRSDTSPDGGDADAEPSVPTPLAVRSGGPFCDLDGDALFVNAAQAGAILRVDEQGATAPLQRYGPFILMRIADALWLLSEQNGSLMIGEPSKPAFALAAHSTHDRPVVAAYGDGLIGQIDSTTADHLELVAWQPEP